MQLHFPLPIESISIYVVLSNKETLQPTYTLEISGKGVVSFSGEKHVKQIGKKTDTLTKYEVLSLVESFITNEFFTLRNFYSHTTTYALIEESIVSQTEMLPESENFTSITLQTDSESKTVKNYSGAPKRFSYLLEEILTLSGAKHWI